MSSAWISYCLLRSCLVLFAFLPVKVIYFLGKVLGLLAYYASKHYRKLIMSNLAIAKNLNLTEKEMCRIAKESFQNLVITTLEYGRMKPKILRFLKSKRVVAPDYPEVLVSGHQANWELCFLHVTSQKKSVAIGRPIKNHYLYQWIISLRELFGGKIISPGKALKEGVLAIKNRWSIGIVGDQALPESSYSYPFFGTRAWTSSAPALLAYKTGSPLVLVTTKRVGYNYHIGYSEPILPDLTQSLKKEVKRMMDEVMRLMEKSISESPGQWLWLHNRWKQGKTHGLKRCFRHDFILFIFPDSEEQAVLIATFREIYPRAFFTIYLPESQRDKESFLDDEIRYYQTDRDLLKREWTFQMLVDFTDNKQIQKHFLSLGVQEVLTEKRLYKLAEKKRPELGRPSSTQQAILQAFKTCD